MGGIASFAMVAMLGIGGIYVIKSGMLQNLFSGLIPSAAAQPDTSSTPAAAPCNPNCEKKDNQYCCSANDSSGKTFTGCAADLSAAQSRTCGLAGGTVSVPGSSSDTKGSCKNSKGQQCYTKNGQTKCAKSCDEAKQLWSITFGSGTGCYNNPKGGKCYEKNGLTSCAADCNGAKKLWSARAKGGGVAPSGPTVPIGSPTAKKGKTSTGSGGSGGCAAAAALSGNPNFCAEQSGLARAVSMAAGVPVARYGNGYLVPHGMKSMVNPRAYYAFDEDWQKTNQDVESDVVGGDEPYAPTELYPGEEEDPSGEMFGTGYDYPETEISNAYLSRSYAAEDSEGSDSFFADDEVLPLYPTDDPGYYALHSANLGRHIEGIGHARAAYDDTNNAMSFIHRKPIAREPALRFGNYY